MEIHICRIKEDVVRMLILAGDEPQQAPHQGLGIVVEQEMSPPLSDWLSAFLDMGTVIPSIHQPVTLRKSSLLLRSDFILHVPTLPT